MVAASGEALQYLLFPRVSGDKKGKQPLSIDIFRRQAATSLRRRQDIDRIINRRSAPLVGARDRHCNLRSRFIAIGFAGGGLQKL
jgi:hypothetical protein